MEKESSSSNSKTRPQNPIQERNPPCSLEEIASRILDSSTGEERKDAALTGAASLSSLRDSNIIPDEQQAATLTKAIVAKILSPQSRLGQQASPSRAEAGLACLDLLSSSPYRMDESTLLTVVAYTDESDSWTTPKSAEAATSILDAQLEGLKQDEFITKAVLQGYLRPLFTKSSTRVTESGRPSYYDVPAERNRPLSQTPLWKQKDHWAVATLGWAVKASEEQLIRNHWPLFTPVLLALAEDEEPKIKSRGLEILAAFVKKCPEQVLHTAGIGRIFEEVTFPTLLSLPSITPEEESTQLLVPAYQVLINLAEAYSDPKNTDRRRLLDKTLRHGIFTSYHHGSQYARVVQTLMHYTTLIINCLGIYSIKHLQNLLSILSSVMTDPFATAYPPALLSAAEALNATITTCWPRFLDSDHNEEIIRIVSLCWLNLHDDVVVACRPSEEHTSAISAKLMQSAKMLQSIWQQHNVLPPKALKEVLEQEPRLKVLFLTSLVHDSNDQ